MARDAPLAKLIDSASQIGFELIERLAVLEAIIVRESMRSDFLAWAGSDLAAEAGTEIVGIGALVRSDFVQIGVCRQRRIGIARPARRQPRQQLVFCLAQ